jgi:hypothetical protein
MDETCRTNGGPKQVSVTVALLTYIPVMLGSNLGRDTDSPSVSWFFLVLQTGAEMVSRIGHCLFLTNNFQFIIYRFSHRTISWTVYNEKSVVK